MTKILVVEDEPYIALGLKSDLALEGYEVEVARDGETAAERARKERFDLILLDVMLPGKDGFAVCRELRHDGVTTPIIMLTAKSQEAEKVLGLELGADDYVTKPFSPRELVARVRAVLRRTRMEDTDAMVRGPLIIDPSRYLVEVDGEEVSLTATEFALLAGMAERPGQVFARGQLLALCQGEYYEGYERTVDTHVKNIRKKLKGKADDWEFIDTVHGVGYRFVARQKA